VVVGNVQFRAVNLEEPQSGAVAAALPCVTEHAGGAIHPNGEVDEAVVVQFAQQSTVAATDFQYL